MYSSAIQNRDLGPNMKMKSTAIQNRDSGPNMKMHSAAMQKIVMRTEHENA